MTERRFRPFDWAGLCLAAIVAPTVTFTVAFLGAVITVSVEAASGFHVTVVVVLMLIFIWGLVIAVFTGTLGAALMLAPFLWLAERLAKRGPRRPVILVCCAAAGLLFATLGLLLAPFDHQTANAVAYVTGLWPWTTIYRKPEPDWPTLIVFAVAPLVGGLAAGWAYEALTRPEPKGLTTAEGGAI